MNKRSLLRPAACLALLTSAVAYAGGEGWSHDFEAAKKQAAAEKKDLLMDFTGSDWCGWCIKLSNEVFKQDAFKTGVKDKFVLVEIDFPEDQSKLDEATKKQNEKLGEKYGIQGYPTVVLADATGRPYASTGYQKGGPEEYVKHLTGLQGRREKQAAALKRAADAKGADKAKALVDSVDGLSEEMVDAYFKDLADQVKAADPDDSTGFVKKAKAKELGASIEEKLGELLPDGKFAEAIEFINKAVADNKLEGEAKQRISGYRMFVFAQQGKFDEAIKVLDEVKAMAPDSELAGQLAGLRERLDQMSKQPPAAAEPPPGASEPEKKGE